MPQTLLGTTARGTSAQAISHTVLLYGDHDKQPEINCRDNDPGPFAVLS